MSVTADASHFEHRIGYRDSGALYDTLERLARCRRSSACFARLISSRRTLVPRPNGALWGRGSPWCQEPSTRVPGTFTRVPRLLHKRKSPRAFPDGIPGPAPYTAKMAPPLKCERKLRDGGED